MQTNAEWLSDWIVQAVSNILDEAVHLTDEEVADGLADAIARITPTQETHQP